MPDSFVTVVSGLPRSGTSMMMQMLEAGGMDVLYDDERRADRDNPRGYYELRRVKALPGGDAEWLDDAEGRAVKVVSALLRWLPRDRSYRVLFLERHLDEVLASQRRMLDHRPGAYDGSDEERLREAFRRHLAQVGRWLETRDNMAVHRVRHRALVTAPERELRAVADFLRLDLDLVAMTAVADPALYRNRAERGSRAGP